MAIQGSDFLILNIIFKSSNRLETLRTCVCVTACVTETAFVLLQRPCVEIQLGDEKLDAVDNFVYLGDCISPGGYCELATIKRCHPAWGKFRGLLPLLTCKAISLNNMWSNV